MKTEKRNSISGLLLIPLLLVCCALLPSVQAAPDPAPPPGANTRDGAGAMANITTGNFNTAFGTNALNKLTTGNNNSAQGNSALFSCINGNGNSAIGSIALRFLTTGNHNVAIGNTALNNITTGSRNTAVGYGTARSGNFSDTTAVGWSALISNTTGGENVAVGAEALASNMSGHNNTGIGFGALASNTIGNFNTSNGSNALAANTMGNNNTAIGTNALLNNATGINNTAIGVNALLSSVGNGNIALGTSAGNGITNGSNNIVIGAAGDPADSGTIRIGNAQTATFIAGIRGASVTGGEAVLIDANGKLGTVTPPSSARFKKEIKPMGESSQVILALKPVTFRYKQDVDPTAGPQFGLIAEEVEKVDPDLVLRNGKGEIESVRYEAVNAMLLNEFLKEHRTVQELKSIVAKQEATNAQQQKQIEALTAGLQKVSAQVETSRRAPQMAENNR